MLKNIFYAKIIFWFLLITSIFLPFSAPFSANAAQDLNEELAYRVRFSKAADVKILLDNKADANYVNNLGIPMVAVAVSRKDNDALPVLKELVKGGADVNQGGGSNQYPIILAIRDNNLEIVKYLAKEKHVNMRVKDLNGLMPLEIAEYNANDAIIDIVKAEKKRQDAILKQLKSPERRNKIMQKWANLYCEKVYLEHYFTVKLDKKTPEEIRATLEKYPPQFDAIIDDLRKNFYVNVKDFVKYVNNFVKPRLYVQFRKMISNRMRRKLGFGTAEDMKARCDKIVEEFAKKLPKS
jgi:hypothetical protein